VSAAISIRQRPAGSRSDPIHLPVFALTARGAIDSMPRAVGKVRNEGAAPTAPHPSMDKTAPPQSSVHVYRIDEVPQYWIERDQPELLRFVGKKQLADVIPGYQCRTLGIDFLPPHCNPQVCQSRQRKPCARMVNCCASIMATPTNSLPRRKFTHHPTPLQDCKVRTDFLPL
jgi:hypothetical protein